MGAGNALKCYNSGVFATHAAAYVSETALSQHGRLATRAKPDTIRRKYEEPTMKIIALATVLIIGAGSAFAEGVVH